MINNLILRLRENLADSLERVLPDTDEDLDSTIFLWGLKWVFNLLSFW